MSDQPLIRETKKSRFRIIIIGVIIIATILISLGVFHVFSSFGDSKETLNLKLEPSSLENLNTTTYLSKIVSISLNGNNTLIILANGEKFQDTSNLATVGKEIQVTENFYKPVCNLNLYDSNNTQISDIFSKLSMNNYIINGTKNSACNSNVTFHQITSVKLMP